ncbi:MAG: methylated-DNA--[protein]-cysteine S-methyltransferase, partial [Alicyclobacillus sp.]|nr:methylated-DNA--[protein]-cysteine S-methyltransferase [Alicyclobacillus sp.]
ADPVHSTRRQTGTPRRSIQPPSPLTAVYVGTVCWRDWTFHLAATERGLCCLTLPNETFGDLLAWLHAHLSAAELKPMPDGLFSALEQLQTYLQGNLRTFTLPLDIFGTSFQKQVWQTLALVPYGEVWTYSQLAAAAGYPKAVRAVAGACAANPLPLVIPCHRIIGKNGRLTGYSGGLELKAALLRLEGGHHPLQSGAHAAFVCHQTPG